MIDVLYVIWSYISGAKDGLVKLWNLDISDLSENYSGHTKAITCIAVAGDEAFIVSGSEDRTVKVWSVMMASVVTDYLVRFKTTLFEFISFSCATMISLAYRMRPHQQCNNTSFLYFL